MDNESAITDMFNSINTPYKEDLELLLSLGLKEFIAEDFVETFLGTVDTENYTIDVFVTCSPAQFWKFIILNKQANTTTTIETGSGFFTEFWTFAEKIGDNMIVVKSLETR